MHACRAGSVEKRAQSLLRRSILKEEAHFSKEEYSISIHIYEQGSGAAGARYRRRAKDQIGETFEYTFRVI